MGILMGLLDDDRALHPDSQNRVMRAMIFVSAGFIEGNGLRSAKHDVTSIPRVIIRFRVMCFVFEVIPCYRCSLFHVDRFRTEVHVRHDHAVNRYAILRDLRACARK